MKAMISREALARISSLASRYGALLAQFVIVILIARHLTKEDAGVYLLVFGAVTSTSVFAGFGAPDGLVKAVPELIHAGHGAAARREIVLSARFTALTSAGLLAILALAGVVTGVDRQAIAFFLPWWAGYAAVFFCGQALVAIGRPHLGAFVFYALNNLLLMVTTAPYLLFSANPTVADALCMSIVASTFAVILGGGLLLRQLFRLPKNGEIRPRAATFRLGLIIAAARMLQAVLYWIPAWAIAIASGPADAAIVGTAGRLLIAATAVIAVFRFTIRSRIVTAAAQGNYAAMERMARVAATIATASSIAALIIVLLVGQPLIAFVFGSSFGEAAPVLAVLLIGAVGESIGGPVDEVLKYNGQAVPVLIGLIATVAIEVVLALGLSRFGPAWAAAAQAAAFCGMYVYQIILCRRRVGITVLPYLSAAKLRHALAAE